MNTSEKALFLHKEWNGKLETTPKSHVKSREDLALAYTPGVAEPCKKIAENPEDAYIYTMKANTVAVVSDGSAVLGLGSLTPKIPQSLDRLIFLCQIYFYVVRTIVLYGIMYLYIYNT